MERRAVTAAALAAAGAVALAGDRAAAAPEAQTSTPGLARCGFIEAGPQPPSGLTVWFRPAAIGRLSPPGASPGAPPGATTLQLVGGTGTVYVAVGRRGPAGRDLRGGGGPAASRDPDRDAPARERDRPGDPHPAAAPTPTPAAGGGPATRCGFLQVRPGGVWLPVSEIVQLAATSGGTTTVYSRFVSSEEAPYLVAVVLDALCAAGA